MPTLETKKYSVVFDEGLQRICYNDLQDLTETDKIFICFFPKTKFTENQNGIRWNTSTAIIRNN